MLQTAITQMAEGTAAVIEQCVTGGQLIIFVKISMQVITLGD